MEFIEIKETENGKPINYVIKSIGIYSLSQIEDSVIKQIISEGLNKLIINKNSTDCNFNNYFWYYAESLHIMSMQFIERKYLSIWEVPRFMRLYKEVMLENGFDENFIIESMESENNNVIKRNTKDIVNGDFIGEEICIRKQNYE